MNQDAEKARGVVQVGGDVHGNVYMVNKEPGARQKSDHYAVKRASVRDIMNAYSQLSKEEQKNVADFCIREFETRVFHDLSAEQRHRVRRFAETLIEKRSSPVIRSSDKRLPKPAMRWLWILAVGFAIMVGYSLLQKAHSQ